jgi:hypothetical protein
MIDRRLCDGQITRIDDHQDPLAGMLKHFHLVKSGNIVHARIGSRIRGENEAGINHGGNTISHEITFTYSKGQR